MKFFRAVIKYILGVTGVYAVAFVVCTILQLDLPTILGWVRDLIYRQSAVKGAEV